jgi:hypothetical protein
MKATADPGTVRTSGTKGTPAAAEMLATSGTHSLAGTQATAKQWRKQQQRRQEQQRC